jgi:phage terminase large subunit
MLEVEKFKVKCLPPFNILYNIPKNTTIVILIGGRGGAKSYEASKFIAKSAIVESKRCVVLRDVRARIKDSILNEIFLRYDKANESGVLNQYFDKQENELKEKKTGKTLIYTQGFKASDNQKKTNLKGSSDIDIAIIEEAEDIRDRDKFLTFWDGIRKKDAIIMLLLNVPDIHHWVIKTYFNLEQVEDGYYKIIPKAIPGFVCIQTSYLDNPFLTQQTVDRYKSYGDPKSNLYDRHRYMTDVLGYASTGRKGQILTKVKPISLKDYMLLPFKEFYGQDFGTASPAGMVGVKFDKSNCYCRQINYLPMSIVNIGKMYCRMKLTNADKIIADSAEPDSIMKLKGGWTANDLTLEDRNKYPGLVRGFYVVPAVKGQGSIKYGISLMTSMNLFAVEESYDLWNEIMNWIYAQDKNGNYTDEPEDAYNHLIDCWRYIISDQRGKKQLYGI